MILDSMGRLLRRGAIGNLERMVSKMHPADVAKVLHHLNSAQEKRTVFELIKPDGTKAQVLSEMDEEDIGETLTDVPAADIAMLIRDLPDDDQAYVLTCLSEERSQDILKLMKPEDSAEVKDLLQYESKTAGAIMTTEYFSLPEHTTAEEAIHKLQGSKDTGNVFYVYVTDKDEKLVGVLSLRQLLQVSPHTRLGTMIKREVISVATDTDQEEVAKLVGRYNLLAIPVVDRDNTLVGIITVDDVVDIIHDAATEDMLKMSGTQIEEEDVLMYSSVFQTVRHRVPWLLTNLIGSIISGSILWFFRYTIEEVVALVTFIPVIAAMGGNVGLQSSTLIIRGLATGRIELSDVKRVFMREVQIGFLIGLLCGVVVLFVAAVMHINLTLGLVVGFAMVCALVVSTSMATIMPVILKRYGVDPAVAAGPFVTTANDITGIAIYLSLATAVLSHLK
ncbi:MAG: magnesium transporter [Nitrospiraceae bacterium]|nr:MAG: magnesium transporter [Nitrospiraceae bacterium]